MWIFRSSRAARRDSPAPTSRAWPTRPPCGQRRQNRKFILMADFEMAKDKVLMGVERKSLILSDEGKEEHCVSRSRARHCGGNDSGCRSGAQGDDYSARHGARLTMQLPTDDKHSYTKEHLEGMLAVLMGGRTAEEMFLGHITTGAGNDIERATDIARNMVCEWGMSELGPLAFGKQGRSDFPGPRDCPASRLQRSHCRGHRQGSEAQSSNRLRKREKHSEHAPRRARAHRAGTSRTRSAGRTRSAHAD